MSASRDASPLVAKLESNLTLSDEERAAILALPMQLALVGPDQDLVREHERPTRCCALLEGWACAYKLTAAGRRQILAFHIPGDIPDLQSLHLKTLDNGIQTLTPCRVGFIQHEHMRALCHAHPRLADAFWRETLIDGAVFREWMLNVGRREAHGRMAHLLCELVTRLRAVGLARDNACELPVTQTEMGDALGLSTVHVNRTLQELRAAGLVRLERGHLAVLDWARLKAAGEFDPVYLHLEEREAV